MLFTTRSFLSGSPRSAVFYFLPSQAGLQVNSTVHISQVQKLGLRRRADKSAQAGPSRVRTPARSYRVTPEPTFPPRTWLCNLQSARVNFYRHRQGPASKMSIKRFLFAVKQQCCKSSGVESTSLKLFPTVKHQGAWCCQREKTFHLKLHWRKTIRVALTFSLN